MSFPNSVRSKNPVEESKPGSHLNFDDDHLGCIQEKISAVEDSSLASTRRCLQMISEATEMGVKTATQLVEQGEKLQRVEEHLDKVNNDLTETQKNLNRMKSIFGGIVNKFTFKSSKKSESKDKVSDKSTSSVSASSSSTTATEVCTEARTGFAVITGSAREEEMNSNLEQLSLGLKGLANLGIDMQRELDKQAPQIDRLNNKSETTKARIDDQNSQMKKLLKK
jgi:hypothetical protein